MSPELLTLFPTCSTLPYGYRNVRISMSECSEKLPLLLLLLNLLIILVTFSAILFWVTPIEWIPPSFSLIVLLILDSDELMIVSNAENELRMFVATTSLNKFLVLS